ncbi:MAG TPA: type II toxin-antitoxin system HicB family antitoxin [Candidatus Acidoferrales bacterium]|nr:type II toxin-antitoxin system HicB family antitoxin [Candidatus Acidoferrales bacterium]
MASNNEFTIIIEKGEDGYLISEVVGLPGCHTQAKTLDQLVKRTKEAIALCLESGQRSDAMFVGVQNVALK